MNNDFKNVINLKLIKCDEGVYRRINHVCLLQNDLPELPTLEQPLRPSLILSFFVTPDAPSSSVENNDLQRGIS